MNIASCRNFSVLFLLLLTGVILPLFDVQADAIMVTRAANAPTVCEVFVEPEEVRIELEIGESDLLAFPLLLPDNVREEYGLAKREQAERLEEFEGGWSIAVDGERVAARIRSIKPGNRIERDLVTGEPLPTADGEEQFSLFVELYYPLAELPASIQFPSPFAKIHPQKRPTVGFVTYHRGVAVNDFRYLTGTESLTLDWEDPWYSRFGSRNLLRQYNSPMNVFLYVEPYEIRVEVIARPSDLQRMVDLGLQDEKTVPVEVHEELKKRVASFVHEKFQLMIDGNVVEAELDRVNFLRRTLRTSSVVDPPEELDIYPATLGLIYSVPTKALPQEVALTWNLFLPKSDTISAAATDEAGPFPSQLTKEDNVLIWKNFLKNPTIPTLVEIQGAPAKKTFGSASVVWVGSAVVFLGMIFSVRGGLRTGGRKLVFGLLILLLVGGIGTGVVLSREAVIDSAQLEPTVGGLIQNVYRAFDYRDESAVYDVLAKSVSGELLTDVYLETQKGLELANQGGARVKVKQVDLLSTESKPIRGEQGFISHCRWNVMGSVGHWGHLHKRTNQYEAELKIQPVSGTWKITELTLLGEERVN